MPGPGFFRINVFIRRNQHFVYPNDLKSIQKNMKSTKYLNLSKIIKEIQNKTLKYKQK
jgi:hypothetical protein